MDIPSLTTPRLKLRPFTLQDVTPLHSILQETDILKYFPNPDPPPVEKVERFINGILKHWQEHGYGWWAVEPRAEDRLIGWSGLTYLPETNEEEVAYLLSRATWKQGLATEAAHACLQFGFEKMGMQRLIAIVHPMNIASQRVAEKIGMTYIGLKEYWGMTFNVYEIRPTA